MSATVTPGDGDAGVPVTPDTDGGSTIPPGGCGTGGGTGSIVVNVTGLPAGLTADIDVQEVATGAATKVTATQTLTTAQDEYKVTAGLVLGATSASDPVVRTVYSATIDTADFCLAASGSSTVNVTYAPLPTSNKLWTTNDSTAQLLGYAETSLTATGAPAATSTAVASVGRAITFDNQGNLWSLGATTTDAAVQRFNASQFATSGAKTADIALTLDAGCQPGWTNMAFDSTGGLWLSSACGQKIVHLTASSLTATGSPTPDVTISGLNAPEGLAFDAAGDLWVADSGTKTLNKYTPAQLTTTSSATPTLVFTPQTEAQADLSANWIAFDKSGALWATDFGGNNLYKLPASDLANTGNLTLVPSSILTLPVDELLEGLAFDESGDAWLTLSAGKIGRLDVAQLTGITAVTPNVILTSADIGSAAALAFYPGASGLPLYSSTLPATH